MTKTETFWIASPQGRRALVAGADQRDEWTVLNGWTASSEPGPTDQVYIQHPDGMTGCIPYEALAEGWADLGWKPGPPPAPVVLTRDPAPVAEAAPDAPKTPPAAGGATNKE